MDLWELTARERIRDALAQYTWSGDAFRLEDLAAAFCDNGTLEIRGEAPLEGRAAIVARLQGVGAPPSDGQRVGQPARIVRHNVTNVRFLELTPQRARVDSYFTVNTEIGLDHYGRYRDRFEPVADAWLIRHRFVSTDWRAENSTMARRDG